MVDLQLPLGQLRIPHFPVPDGETVETLAAQGVPARASRERYGDGHRRSSRRGSTTSSA